MPRFSKSKIRERRLHWQNRYKMFHGCQMCRYNKHPRALTFDHLDPSQKNPIVKNGGEGTKTRAGGMWQLTDASIPIKVMIDEWRKCRILCFNCHMEDKYQYYKW